MERLMAYRRMLLLPLPPSVHDWIQIKLHHEIDTFHREIKSLDSNQLVLHMELLNDLLHNDYVRRDGWTEIILSTLHMYQQALPKYKKKSIPSALKRKVWYVYMGEEKGVGLCTCCGISKINQFSFHCGHVVSEKNGGEMNVDNLRPICQNCNSSMGTKNMTEFKKMLSV